MALVRYPPPGRRNVDRLSYPQSGYLLSVRTNDDDTRSVEQEVAAGQSETTPVFAIGSVVVVIAALFAVALTLAVLAYFLV
ncbi:MAG TPA: hypothetical protein VMK83_07680 [Gaiellaceae bacterium]|nr:hypothetical protein [Gaiellaceae bacterium]